MFTGGVRKLEMLGNSIVNRAEIGRKFLEKSNSEK